MRMPLSFKQLKTELRYYQHVFAHAQTPRLAKWLLGFAIAYLLSPIDIIPDFIPMIGQLDDLLLVPALVWVAMQLIPEQIKQEARTLAQA